jgi:hypothetical protein
MQKKEGKLYPPSDLLDTVSNHHDLPPQKQFWKLQCSWKHYKEAMWKTGVRRINVICSELCLTQDSGVGGVERVHSIGRIEVHTKIWLRNLLRKGHMES